MTSSCGQSSLGELKARLPGGAFTTSLRHERGACSTHFDVFFVEQPGAVEKKIEWSSLLSFRNRPHHNSMTATRPR
jgi:hypothetical protein